MKIYFFISEFIKNFLLKDNIDLWNEMKDSLYYFTIFTSIQTLLFIYYITKMRPQDDNPELSELEVVPELPELPELQIKEPEVVPELPIEELEVISEVVELPKEQIDTILDSLNNLEQRLNIIRMDFDDTLSY
jgi:hypothetical protein